MRTYSEKTSAKDMDTYASSKDCPKSRFQTLKRWHTVAMSAYSGSTSASIVSRLERILPAHQQPENLSSVKQKLILKVKWLSAHLFLAEHH